VTYNGRRDESATAAPVVVFQVGLPQGHLLGGVQALGAQRTPLKVTCGNKFVNYHNDAGKCENIWELHAVSTK